MSKENGEKIYVGNGRNIKTNYGDMLILKFHTEDIDKMKEWQDKNEGWVTLKILQRKEPSKKGFTHYGVIDQWKPKQSTANNEPAGAGAGADAAPADDQNDLPF